MQGIPAGCCFECIETPENALLVNPLCTMSQGAPPLLKCIRVQDVLLSVQGCSACRTDFGRFKAWRIHQLPLHIYCAWWMAKTGSSLWAMCDQLLGVTEEHGLIWSWRLFWFDFVFCEMCCQQQEKASWRVLREVVFSFFFLFKKVFVYKIGQGCEIQLRISCSKRISFTWD